MKLDIELSKNGQFTFEYQMDGADTCLVGDLLEIYRDGEPWGWVGLRFESDKELVEFHETLSWALYHRGLGPRPGEVEA